MSVRTFLTVAMLIMVCSSTTRAINIKFGWSPAVTTGELPREVFQCRPRFAVNATAAAFPYGKYARRGLEDVTVVVADLMQIINNLVAMKGDNREEWLPHAVEDLGDGLSLVQGYRAHVGALARSVSPGMGPLDIQVACRAAAEIRVYWRRLLRPLGECIGELSAFPAYGYTPTPYDVVQDIGRVINRLEICRTHVTRVVTWLEGGDDY